MQIHLFISREAPAKKRLKSSIHDALTDADPLVEYHSPQAFGRLLPSNYNEKAIAVIMIGFKEELRILSRMPEVWERLKTILILPNDFPDCQQLTHSLRPVYVAFMDDDFSAIASIIEKIFNNIRH